MGGERDSVYWNIKKTISKNQWWEPDQINNWKLKKLKHIINYAYRNINGYNKLYNEAGVRPEDIKSLDDIKLLPFVTKQLLRDNLSDFTNKNIVKWKKYYNTTGGSTGIPFGFYNSDNSQIEDAFIHSGWERIGWELGGMTASLRGAFIGSEKNYYEYDKVWNVLNISNYYLTKDTLPKYITVIKKYNPKYLHAYPSAATILSDFIIDSGSVGQIAFKMIFLGSEGLYNWQKAIIRQAFPDTPIFNWYGHAEKNILADWCEKNEKYHINPFYGHVEILNKHNKEVTIGKIGELVGTSYWNYATPFIRYKTMDTARKGEAKCTDCGRNYLILENIEGRLQEEIITSTGRKISMTSINMHNDVFNNIKQFRFKQICKEEIILNVIKKDEYNQKDEAYIYKELKKKLGNDIALKINYVDKISKNKSGKHFFLDQQIKF